MYRSDKAYVGDQKKNKMAPDMIYKARITKNTDIERRRISENYKIAKQPCWVPNIRYGARA